MVTHTALDSGEALIFKISVDEAKPDALMHDDSRQLNVLNNVQETSHPAELLPICWYAFNGAF